MTSRRRQSSIRIFFEPRVTPPISIFPFPASAQLRVCACAIRHSARPSLFCRLTAASCSSRSLSFSSAFSPPAIWPTTVHQAPTTTARGIDDGSIDVSPKKRWEEAAVLAGTDARRRRRRGDDDHGDEGEGSIGPPNGTPQGRRKEASRRRVASPGGSLSEHGESDDSDCERFRIRRSVGRLANRRGGGRRFGPRPVPNPAPARGLNKSRRSPRPATRTTEACPGRPRRCPFTRG